jgi:hypothetical protein
LLALVWFFVTPQRRDLMHPAHAPCCWCLQLTRDLDFWYLKADLFVLMSCCGLVSPYLQYAIFFALLSALSRNLQTARKNMYCCAYCCRNTCLRNFAALELCIFCKQ